MQPRGMGRVCPPRWGPPAGCRARRQDLSPRSPGQERTCPAWRRYLTSPIAELSHPVQPAGKPRPPPATGAAACTHPAEPSAAPPPRRRPRLRPAPPSFSRRVAAPPPAPSRRPSSRRPPAPGPPSQLHLVRVGGQQDVELGFCRSIHLGPERRRRATSCPARVRARRKMGFAALRCLSHRSLARSRGRGRGGGRAGNGARGGAGSAGGSVTRRRRLVCSPGPALPRLPRSAPGPAHPGDEGRGTPARAQRRAGGAEEDVRHALCLSGARPRPEAAGHPSA